jgi:hypothetical protein
VEPEVVVVVDVLVVGVEVVVLSEKRVVVEVVVRATQMGWFKAEPGNQSPTHKGPWVPLLEPAAQHPTKILTGHL